MWLLSPILPYRVVGQHYNKPASRAIRRWLSFSWELGPTQTYRTRWGQDGTVHRMHTTLNERRYVMHTVKPEAILPTPLYLTKWVVPIFITIFFAENLSIMHDHSSCKVTRVSMILTCADWVIPLYIYTLTIKLSISCMCLSLLLRAVRLVLRILSLQLQTFQLTCNSRVTPGFCRVHSLPRIE